MPTAIYYRYAQRKGLITYELALFRSSKIHIMVYLPVKSISSILHISKK